MNMQGCKRDAWCRDRDVSATSPRRNVQNNVSRRSSRDYSL